MSKLSNLPKFSNFFIGASQNQVPLTGGGFRGWVTHSGTATILRAKKKALPNGKALHYRKVTTKITSSYSFWYIVLYGITKNRNRRYRLRSLSNLPLFYMPLLNCMVHKFFYWRHYLRT